MPSVVPALVIFDCDGVLVDSENLLLDVRVEMLDELGLSMSRTELVDRFVGTPNADFVAEIERRLGRSLPSDWDADYRDRSRQAFEQGITPVPGIVDALDQLAIMGHATCVASSGSHEKIEMTLGLTGLLPRFQGRIFSGVDVGNGKPAPDLFLLAADRMGFLPHVCVVVEDSAAGVAAGLAAGMAVIAYAGSVTPRSSLERAGVTLIDDMARLVPTLRELEAARTGQTPADQVSHELGSRDE